jgi:hypothetical protein
VTVVVLVVVVLLVCSTNGHHQRGTDHRMMMHFCNCCSIFKKRSTSGKCLFILVGHTCHCSLEALSYGRRNAIGMLYLPPHNTHLESCS